MKLRETQKERKTLDWIIECSRRAPGGLKDITCHSMARMVRMRLQMTQQELADRVGIPQSHLARIESGRVDIQISTMKRIFQALHCEPIVLPRPIKDLDRIIAERESSRKGKRTARRAGKRVKLIRSGSRRRK